MVNSGGCARLPRAFYILTLCLLATARNEEIRLNFEDVTIQRLIYNGYKMTTNKAQLKVSKTFLAKKTLLLFVFELPQHHGILWYVCMWYSALVSCTWTRSARTARVTSKIPSCYWRKNLLSSVLKCSFALSVKTCLGLYPIRCIQVLISVL